MREQPEAGGSALVVPKSRGCEVPLHLRGDSVEEIETLFLFGAIAGCARLLRKAQFRPKARHVFMFPSVQNTAGLLGGVELHIAHTLVGLSA